jgi:site-specific DNA recombinase
MNNTHKPREPARVGCYLRVSTEEQARKVNPIATQRSVCEETLIRHFGEDGYSAEWFEDEGLSGTLGPAEDGDNGKHRPEFTRLIRSVGDGRVDLVCCQSLDRLARDETDMFRLRELLADTGVTIITPDREYDLTDAEDCLMLGVHTLMAAFQPRQTGVKSAEGKRQRARRGLPKSGGAPYGWRLQTVKEAGDAADRRLVPVEEEALWVMRMADKYLQGWGYHRIARWLTEQEAPGPGKNGWYKMAVKQLLENEKHTGLIKVNEGEYVEGQHYADRIYDPEMFHEIQREMERRAQLPGLSSKDSYWLTGTLTCGECGGLMRASTHSERRYYQHSSSWDASHEDCDVGACNADHVETAAVRAIRDFAESDRIQRLVSDELDGLLSTDDRELQKQVEAKRKELVNAEDQLQWLISQAVKRPELRDQFDVQVKEHQERIERLEAEVEDLQRRAGDITLRERRAERVYEIVSDFDRLWNSMDADERRQVVHLVFDELALLPDTAGYTLRMKVFLDEPREVFIPAGKASDRPKYGPKSLTPREASALYLTDRSHSMDEIAQLWGTGRANVYAALHRARRKMQAETTQDAINMARDHLKEIAPFLPTSGRLEIPPAPEELTETERKLLPDIVNEDVPYREIAEKHEIAEGTVKVHAANIARKLRARGRSELIDQAKRLGLLDDDKENGDG